MEVQDETNELNQKKKTWTHKINGTKTTRQVGEEVNIMELKRIEEEALNSLKPRATKAHDTTWWLLLVSIEVAWRMEAPWMMLDAEAWRKEV